MGPPWPSVLQDHCPITTCWAIPPPGLVHIVSGAADLPSVVLWPRSPWSKIPTGEPLPNPREEGAGQEAGGASSTVGLSLKHCNPRPEWAVEMGCGEGGGEGVWGIRK